MASLEKQTFPEPEENGPAGQAGILLNGTERPLAHIPPDMEESVLIGVVEPLTVSPDPITALRRINEAQTRFGEIDVRATPGGPTQIFTSEASLIEHAEKEAQRVREEIQQIYSSGEQSAE